jgi:hypothetical protein
MSFHSTNKNNTICKESTKEVKRKRCQIVPIVPNIAQKKICSEIPIKGKMGQIWPKHNLAPMFS